ncbi:FAD-dependent oxidoreductase [Pseudonocardiaceae bacterium YIM PH 21723]|nr:FAD-dependent oxidoreductase [Pseudonocardiaceae bacterium YIM PH 21723]
MPDPVCDGRRCVLSPWLSAGVLGIGDGLMPDRRVQVLVVGAGYAGLSAALCLSWRGVDVLLVERHAGESVHPKAWGLSARAMELLRAVPGVEKALREQALTGPRSTNIAFAGSLVDPEPRIIFQRGPEHRRRLAEITPVSEVSLPQAQIERLLQDLAREHGAQLSFNTELVSFEQDDTGVRAHLRNRGDGTEQVVLADYLVAADGHDSPVRAALNIATTGAGALQYTHAAVFDADLREHLDATELRVWTIVNDAFNGTFLSGPGAAGHTAAIYYDPAQGENIPDASDERCVELIRSATGIPELEVALRGRVTFSINHTIADRFSAARVFLIGDAAHTMPPTGGQGGSTAAIDGFDIAWRLALILKGVAGAELADTYDQERRPVGTKIANQHLAGMERILKPEQRVGLETPVDPITLMYGYRYQSQAIVGAGPGADLLEDPREPSGAPGSRAPHVPLLRSGKQISTLDLFGTAFVLIAGSDGADWTTATIDAARELGVEVDTYELDREVSDPTESWYQRYGVTRSGAVLIRPDGHIAWRASTTASDLTIGQVLSQILHRPHS